MTGMPASGTLQPDDGGESQALCVIFRPYRTQRPLAAASSQTVLLIAVFLNTLGGRALSSSSSFAGRSTYEVNDAWFASLPWSSTKTARFVFSRNLRSFSFFLLLLFEKSVRILGNSSDSRNSESNFRSHSAGQAKRSIELPFALRDSCTSMSFPNMRRRRTPRLQGFKNYLNNCFCDSCTSMLFPNMRGPCIPQLLGFKSYSNKCFGNCCTTMLFLNMRGPRISQLLGFKNYLNNCSGDCCTSMSFPNMRGPGIPRLPGFKNYLNNCFADCYTSKLFLNKRGPRIPQLLGFKNYLYNCFADCCTTMIFLNMRRARIPRLPGIKDYLNNCFADCCTSSYSQICMDLVSPGYLGLKIT